LILPAKKTVAGRLFYSGFKPPIDSSTSLPLKFLRPMTEQHRSRFLFLFPDLPFPFLEQATGKLVQLIQFLLDLFQEGIKIGISILNHLTYQPQMIFQLLHRSLSIPRIAVS
jgi:hypothetical protein